MINSTNLIVKMLLFALTSCLLIGCSKQVKPDLLKVDDVSELPKINTTHSIKIIPNYVDKDKNFKLCGNGIISFSAHPNDLTDTAKDSLTEMLKLEKINISEQGDKTITIAVTQADCADLGVMLKLSVTLSVKTGDNKTIEFNNDQKVGPNLHFIDAGVNASIRRALNDILENDSIVKYLEN